MALSPKEERELQQIELDLLRSDPEMAYRMRLPAHHQDLLALVGICLLTSSVLIAVLALPHAPVLLVASALCVLLAAGCFAVAFGGMWDRWRRTPPRH